MLDDKSEHCIPFILERLSDKKKDGASQEPLLLGLNGAQGSGKTTLVSLTIPRSILIVSSTRTVGETCRSRQPSTVHLSWLWVTIIDLFSNFEICFRYFNPCLSSQASFYILVAPI